MVLLPGVREPVADSLVGHRLHLVEGRRPVVEEDSWVPPRPPPRQPARPHRPPPPRRSSPEVATTEGNILATSVPGAGGTSGRDVRASRLLTRGGAGAGWSRPSDHACGPPPSTPVPHTPRNSLPTGSLPRIPSPAVPPTLRIRLDSRLPP